jgi:hypothetical protein
MSDNTLHDSPAADVSAMTSAYFVLSQMLVAGPGTVVASN